MNKQTGFSSFFRREDGSLSVEAVFAIPLLVWVGLAMIVFFDAFRQVNAGQKATFAVADMLSREANREIDANYMVAALETFEFLTNGNGDNSLRITVVEMVEDPITLIRTPECVWSEGVGGVAGYDDITPILPRLPDFAPGDQLIFVEGEHTWSPGFSVGLTNYRFGEVAVMSHREAQLKWKGGGDCA